MTAQLIGKQRDWQLDRDDEGHRTYKITWLVLTDDYGDGPYVVLNCSALPAAGSAWAFDNDFDDWAWCRTEMTIRRYKPQEGAKHRLWTVEQTFSTKPPSKPRCQDVPVENPLLEPARISGGGVKYTEPAIFDRFGNPLFTSSHERFADNLVEFDGNRNTVKIEQNVGSWTDVADAIDETDKVNALPLWGVPPRCVKLSNVSWERQFWQKCVIYFKRTLTFDIWIKSDPNTGAPVSGFDKILMDVGTKVLRGQFNSAGVWVLKKFEDYAGTPNPDPDNPSHFDRFRDTRNEVCTCLLDGAGLPANTSVLGEGYFVSLDPGNVGNPLDDATRWLPVVGPQVPALYDPDAEYQSGNLVYTPGGFGFPVQYFACTQDGTTGAAQAPTIPANVGVRWVDLGTSVPVGAGNYNEVTTYDVGAIVRNASGPRGPARFNVEYYEETDFTALNIPVDFSVP